ncbi:MAG TPA: hypothetical protein VEI03_18575 [Stellaceae bacterium]|nr:hypothetical protein [Stellaceae bacterium]
MTMAHAIGRTLLAVAALAGPAAFLPAQAETAAWPDTFLARLEATALVQTLNGEILAASSATLALDKWCGDHRLAGTGEAKVVAHLIPGAKEQATPEQRQRLGVGPDEPIRYRRVELVCGDHLLSVADNWYVPSRLTPEMNHLLETTDTPFGRAVLALNFTRRTFAATVLWRPLPDAWETRPVPRFAGGASMPIPQALFEHRAVLYTKDGLAFSEVRETYQRPLLDFPLPGP